MIFPCVVLRREKGVRNSEYVGIREKVILYVSVCKRYTTPRCIPVVRYINQKACFSSQSMLKYIIRTKVR